jgi:hypothetical protein
MAREEAVSGGPSSIEDLRRRVYGADATDEDRDRYRAALEETEPPVADAPPAPPHPPAARRRRRPLRPIAAAAAVLALVGFAVTRLPSSPTEPSRADAVPSPATITVDDETRGEFIQNLAFRGAAGIAAYLVTHRSPADLRTATRFYTIERHGTGPRLLSLDPAPREAVKGRATVILVTEWAGWAGWTAYRVRIGSDGLSALEPEAGRAGAQEGGVPTTDTFAYGSGRRPVSLRIEVPEGTRWGVGVVFSD